MVKERERENEWVRKNEEVIERWIKDIFIKRFSEGNARIHMD